jgi:hypothetical protein
MWCGNAPRHRLNRGDLTDRRAHLQGRPECVQGDFRGRQFPGDRSEPENGREGQSARYPAPSIVYYLTDCKSKLYAADGKTTETTNKVGTANAVPVIASHSAENIGTTDCKQLFVEKK